MKTTLLLLSLFLSTSNFSQSISSEELLNKAIAFHDPTSSWTKFNDSLHIVMTTPSSGNRNSRLHINLPAEYFSVSATVDNKTTYYEVSKGQCQMKLNGKVVDELTAKENGMSCERATLYKNYYTYLYGLPMKLKDPGTNTNYPVEKKEFKGKEYLVLKATYDASVGKDVWFFYFDPSTYAMEVYQFFKTDDSGKMISDSGEYITLEGISEVGRIKMPKVRTWYYNKDNKLLGVDTLVD